MTMAQLTADAWARYRFENMQTDEIERFVFAYCEKVLQMVNIHTIRFDEAEKGIFFDEVCRRHRFFAAKGRME